MTGHARRSHSPMDPVTTWQFGPAGGAKPDTDSEVCDLGLEGGQPRNPAAPRL